MTTDYVLSETVTRMAQQANRKAAGRAWDEIEAGRGVRLIEVTRDHRREARRFLEKYAQLTLSLVDCASFAVMRELGLTEAATFDEDFVKAGFTALPLKRQSGGRPQGPGQRHPRDRPGGADVLQARNVP